MSGAEASFVIGLISGVISIIEATKTVYDAAKDAHGQPEAFRQVAARLPLVVNILNNVKKRAQTLDEADQDALEPTLESCKTKAEALEKIFRKVARKDDDKWYDRYKKAVVSTLGKQGRVEGLMEGILKDINVLACEKLMGTASDAEVEEIKEAMKQMKDMPSSLEEETGDVLQQQHSGSGDNIGATGGSTQNIHKGTGDQYHNEIAGDAHFGSKK
jgi:F0F1-type ATP synthase delta subunit